MESGETVRLGAHLEPARGLGLHRAARDRPTRPSGRASRGPRASSGPSHRASAATEAAILATRRSAPPPRPTRRRTANKCSRRGPAGWARCPYAARRTGWHRCGGPLPRAARAKIAVVVAGHRDPDPAALDQLVAKLAGELEAELLFADFARDADGAGIGSPMSGVDHDDRAAGGLRGAMMRSEIAAEARPSGRPDAPRRSRAAAISAECPPRLRRSRPQQPRQRLSPRRQLQSCAVSTVPTRRPPSTVLPTYHGNMVNRSLSMRFSAALRPSRCCAASAGC